MMTILSIGVVLAAIGGFWLVAWLIGSLIEDPDIAEPRYRDHAWMTEEHKRTVRDAAVWRGYRRHE